MRGKFFYMSMAVMSLALISQTAAAQFRLFAISKPANAFEYVYMDGLGKPVGGKTYHCNGAQTQWGTAGVFQEVHITPCG